MASSSRNTVPAGPGGRKPLFQLSKSDVYVRELRQLACAEYPSDTLERMLAVIRLLISCLTDILRPSNVYRDTPHVLIGVHLLTQRELGPSGTLDGFLRGYIQELCSFEESEKPYKREEQGTQVASMSLKMHPKAVVRAKGHLKSKGLHVEVDLGGSGSVWFSYHEEDYEVTGLPCLILEDPMSLRCIPDFVGERAHRLCPLLPSLHFLEERTGSR